jgi:hypothetical protein
MRSVSSYDQALRRAVRLTYRQADPALPEKSVLGLRVGDRIELTGPQFRRLSNAFLAEIEDRYP